MKTGNSTIAQYSTQVKWKSADRQSITIKVLARQRRSTNAAASLARMVQEAET